MPATPAPRGHRPSTLRRPSGSSAPTAPWRATHAGWPSSRTSSSAPTSSTKSGVDEISTADMKMVATLFLLSKSGQESIIDGAAWNMAHVWPGMSEVEDKGKNEKAYKVGHPRPAEAREWIWRVLAEAKSPEQVMRLLRAIVTATQFRHDDLPRSQQLNHGLPSRHGESSEHASELYRQALLTSAAWPRSACPRPCWRPTTSARPRATTTTSSLRHLDVRRAQARAAAGATARAGRARAARA